MQKRNKVLAGVLTGALVLSAGPMALAATANYNDSSVTGGSAAWQDWVKEWETVAADYTKVSLTPGADETQLNFAWYSKTESGKAATPVVHFGTDKDHLTAFTGKAAQVDDSLTDGVAYDYNHVTVTGLEANTTYYYTVEKNGVQSEVQEYKTGSFDSVKMLYVGDPQIGASKGQPQNGEALRPAPARPTPPPATTPSPGTAPWRSPLPRTPASTSSSPPATRSIRPARPRRRSTRATSPPPCWPGCPWPPPSATTTP